MRSIVVALVVGSLGLVSPVGAQERPQTQPARGWSRSVVHYGKWATAATAVGLTILAAREHGRAQNDWRQLLDLCQSNNAACQLRSDGQYVDYDAELLYQRTTYYDRRARSRLIGGQVALLVSAAMFIIDLRHHGGDAPNIPFHGLELSVAPQGDGARLELRLPF